MDTSSASRFSFNCLAIRGSHPNNLIIRMTFITACHGKNVSFAQDKEIRQRSVLSVTDWTRASVYGYIAENTFTFTGDRGSTHTRCIFSRWDPWMCLVIHPGTGSVINMVARPTKALPEGYSIGIQRPESQRRAPPSKKLIQEDHAERDLERRFQHYTGL